MCKFHLLHQRHLPILRYLKGKWTYYGENLERMPEQAQYREHIFTGNKSKASN